MSTDPRREELDAAVLRWMREASSAEAWFGDEKHFNDLALEVFAFQALHCEPYARYCAAVGAPTPDDWREIPSVPAGAFKELRLASFDESATAKVFRTSGTSAGRCGELHLDTLELYEASLLLTLERLLLESPASQGGERIRVLAPSADEAPDTSLSHMFDRLLAKHGDAQSGFDVRGGALDVHGLLEALDTARSESEPVTLLGTAFAFVHLLEALDERGLASLPMLPPGSRAMETGGFKGRSREVERGVLHTAIANRIGFEAGRVVNQYGMTELASQFYDSSLVEPAAPVRKLGPPWARVRVVDPETGSDVESGEVGMIAILDLANTGSVAAILTADLGREIAAPGSPYGNGFEVLGRQPGAEERGCSIAADLMLGNE